jgi:hypothetical protein
MRLPAFQNSELALINATFQILLNQNQERYFVQGPMMVMFILRIRERQGFTSHSTHTNPARVGRFRDQALGVDELDGLEMQHQTLSPEMLSFLT